MKLPSGLQFTARIGSLPDDIFAVYEFQISEALSDIYELALTLYSADPAIAAADVLDQVRNWSFTKVAKSSAGSMVSSANLAVGTQGIAVPVMI